MEATSIRNPLSTPHPFSNQRSTPSTTKRKPRQQQIKSQNHQTLEIRVCVNRSCNRQGSRSILDVLSSLAPPAIAVSSCGCLGRCGAGPNLAVIPPGSVVGHCGTTARAARVLAEICGPQFDAERNLEALALRKKGEGEVEKGQLDEAEELFSRAIALWPSGGLHFIYKCRSAVRLARGDNERALEDAEEACRIAPVFPQGYICQGDAFMAMEEWAAAEEAYSNALLIDPSIRRSKSFKAKVTKLQEKLVVSDASS